jgi:hypothetical protein
LTDTEEDVASHGMVATAANTALTSTEEDVVSHVISYRTAEVVYDENDEVYVITYNL